MANEEHLKILNQGVEVWNKWREENPGIAPDLRRAYLGFRNLNEVNLSIASLDGVDFSRSFLIGANLSDASLTDASFISAILIEADLSNANLLDANLSHANLSQAKLSDADLIDANLSEVDLTGADLTRAHLYGTVFAGVCLKGVSGLSECHHDGPSTIDHRTIQRSGMLPLKFLRGCGLPDVVIDSFRSLVDQPYYSCFISYSTKDKEFVEKLHVDLQDNNIGCWFAPRDMQAGKKVHEQIEEAIKRYDRLLLVLSENSMNSEWVKTEIANARNREGKEKKQILFPISLVDFETIQNWKCLDADTGKDSAREIREYFIPDFQNWRDDGEYQKSFERLLRDIKA